jgi:hypothetical protein
MDHELMLRDSLNLAEVPLDEKVDIRDPREIGHDFTAPTRYSTQAIY